MIPVFFQGRACRSGLSERTLLAIRPDLFPARQPCLAGFRHTLTKKGISEMIKRRRVAALALVDWYV